MALSGKKNASFLWPGLVVGVWYKLELRQREHGGAVSNLVSCLDVLTDIVAVCVRSDPGRHEGVFPGEQQGRVDLVYTVGTTH